MSESNNSGQAFPAPLAWSDVHGVLEALPGMSLRDYFAGQALTAFVGHHTSPANMRDERNAIEIAEWAYRVADAMLNERS